MENVKRYIINQVASKSLNATQAAVMLREIQEGSARREEDIAIIGISGKFPCANSTEEYWNNIIEGKCLIREFPQSRRYDTDPYLSETLKKMKEPYQIQGYIEEIDKFDAAFFNLTPAEVAAMDPYHRFLLQIVWESIEDAGLGGNKLYGSKTGVFIGKAHMGEPLYKDFIDEKDEHVFTGSVSSIISSRISYILNLRGPSIVVDTACSSGLVALHMACQSLKDGECEQAIAGGISLSLFPNKDISVKMLESPKSELLLFDNRSSGTVWGEGAGSIVLKPLSKAIADNDNIYSIIKGSAVNNDGASNGITAPNPEAQEELLVNAWNQAGIKPETIGYIEAHGTGTALGDPIEIKAITNAFKRYTSKNQFCAIGGVKPNIGHLIAASGIASLIKAILALKHGQIPPTIKFERPSEYINFCNSPVYVSDRLTEWETNDYPRRAGVSSFGLSGTNCHVVLEEAPVYKNDDNHNDSETKILTLSAKKEDLLKELLVSYKKYLNDVQDISVEDICFTSCTGRGHYNNRLILVIKDMQDLKEKIYNLCKYKSLSDIDLKGAYYGEFKVVTSAKKLISKSDITEEQRRELTKNAVLKIQNFVDTGKRDYVLLEDICRLYTKGASIDWEGFYRGEKRRRVSIPFYPFDKKHFWASVKNNKVELSKQQEEIIHPLVEKCLAESAYCDIYSTELSSDYWILDGHRILDNCVIPGTAYIEMALCIGKRYYGEGIELQDVMILMPFILQDGDTKEIQIIIKREKNYLDFAIVSKKDNVNSNDDWIEHVTGKISKVPNNTGKSCNISDITQSCEGEEKLLDPEELSRGFIKFGQRWIKCCKIKGNKNKTIAKLTLPVEFSDDLKQYYAHPALLDMAVNAAGFLVGENYLPLSYSSFKLYGPITREFYSYIRSRDNEMGETISYDIELIDNTGKIFGEICGYVIKKAQGLEKLFSTESIYSRRRWITSEIQQESKTFETVMIISNDNELLNEASIVLNKQAKNVIEVEEGSEFKAEQFKRYITGSDESDYRQLLNYIKGNKISHIIHLRSKSAAIGEKEFLSENMNHSIDSTFNLIKAIVNSNIKEELELVFIENSIYDITGSEPNLNPYGAGVFALAKTVGREHANIKIKCIDVDEDTSVAVTLNELNSDYYGNLCAYRNGERYTEIISKVDNEDLSDEPVEIQEDGVYVITGGTGAIGLEMARYLAEKNKINVILINRSVFPERDKWDGILKSGENEKICEIINVIREIEANGTHAYIYSADISKEQDIKKVLDDVRNKYGRINGVIHSAGVAGNSFISSESMETFHSVLNPKIYGVCLLDKLTRQDNLDFFVMNSSVAAIIGIPGQSDYSAANAFLDAYASYREMAINKKTISINWPAWKEVGMAVKHGANVDTVFKAITSRQAMLAFKEIFNKKSRNIIVGEWNYSGFEIIEQLSLNLSDEILHRLQQSRKRSTALMHTSPTDSPIVLKGREDDKYTPTEKSVAKIWAKVLGFEELNIYENFYDLGGDSITAVKLINALNKQLNLNVNISEVFNYLTVSEFAAYIDLNNHSGDKMTRAKQNIKPCSKKEFYPVSSEQSRLYVLYQLSPESTSYNLPGAFEIIGNLDKEQLKEAIRKLIERHEALRTYFEMVEGFLVQRIMENIDIELEEVEAEEDDVQDIIKRFIRPFDLSVAPIFRVMLIKINEQRHLLAIDIHHIIADGSSIAILVKDFIALYSDVRLPELTVQYKDYATHQNILSESPEMKKYEEFWMDRLSGEIPVLNMASDYKRPPVQSFEGDKIEFTVDSDLTAEIKKISSENNATLYMTMLAVYNILLSKYSAQDDIIVGSPVAGRLDQELENVIGMFVNTLPMRNTPSLSKSFVEFLSEVRENTLKSFDNQHLRLEFLIKNLDTERDTSRNPIFDTTFILQNADKDIEITNFGMPDIKIQMGQLEFKTFRFEHNISQFDITLEALERQNEIKCYLVYCTKLFKKETISRMAMHFINILKQITENPAVKIGEITAISEQEKRQILYDFNNTKAYYRKNALVHELFEEQVRKNPNNTAVIFRDETITYSQLNEKSNQLARVLKKEGIGRESIVGLMVYRSFEMIIGIMAVLKAGGAYMPISPDYPEDRVTFMLEDSKAEVLLTQNQNAENIEFSGKIINLDDSSLYQGDTSDLDKINSSGDMAYVIYTSGSTGKPKGAVIEHSSVINRINWMQKAYPIFEYDVILQKTPYTFDVSVWELFWWSFQGSKVCMLEPGGEKYPEIIVEAVEKKRVTIMHFVPSMLNIFMEYVENSAELERLKSLRHVFASGEALQLQSVKKFNRLMYESFDTKLHNLYGPTEATVDVSYFDCSTGDDFALIPIGKPIDNIHLYVLDSNNKLQPIGISGELCISGDGVGRGYINRPELTKEKFIDDPFFPELRMYKTGDLTRWMPDGNIEYIGRIDHQVKIRGFRIELGEIEAAIRNYGHVKEVIVVDRKDTYDNKYLCAYLVYDEGLEIEKLRSYLQSILPDYMVPAYFIKLSEMPLLSNGKINRKQLPEPQHSLERENDYVAPRNKIEEVMAKVWTDVLGVNTGITDNFFNIGGDSIKAIQIAARLKNNGIKLDIRELFQYPLISELSTRVKEIENVCDLNNEKNISPELMELIKNSDSLKDRDIQKAYGLTYLQQGMLFHYLLRKGDGAYFDQFEIAISGKVNIDYLQMSLDMIVKRYDVLRTVFVYEKMDKPVQAILKHNFNRIIYFDLADMNESNQIRYIESFLKEDKERGFDLSFEPGMRLTLLRKSENSYILIWDFHHIIIDGWSEGIIWNEFINIYNSLVNNTSISLPENMPYSKYINWLESIDKEEAGQYWSEYLSGYSQKATISNYMENSEKREYIFEKISFTVSKALTTKLREIANKNNVTLNIVFQTAWGILLQKYNNTDDVVFGVVVSGRPAEVNGVETMVGLLLNTLPMRVKSVTGQTFSALLEHVQDNLVKSNSYEYYPLYEIQKKTDLKQDLFNHIIVYQNFPLEFSTKGQMLGDCTIVDFKVNDQTSFDFNITVIPEEEMIVTFKYNSNVFSKEVIESTFMHLEQIFNVIAENPFVEVRDIDIVSSKELDYMISDFNDDM